MIETKEKSKGIGRDELEALNKELFASRTTTRKEETQAITPTSMSSLEARTLRALAESRGYRSAGRNLANKLGLSYEDMDPVYRRLGNADYVDYSSTGMVTLTAQGMAAMKVREREFFRPLRVKKDATRDSIHSILSKAGIIGLVREKLEAEKEREAKEAAREREGSKDSPTPKGLEEKGVEKLSAQRARIGEVLKVVAFTPESKGQVALREAESKDSPVSILEIKKSPEVIFARVAQKEKNPKATPTSKPQVKRSPEELFLRRANIRREAKGLSPAQAQTSGEGLSLKQLELETLVALGEKGGRTAGRILADKVGYSYEYMDHIYRSLGRADYIDYLGSGVCVLKPKGRELVSKQEGEMEETAHKAQVQREKEMLQRLVGFMAKDNIFNGSEEKGDWVLGGVKCSVNRKPSGWDLLVVALERSRFIERWGWEELLGVYLAELDNGLSLESYSRLAPEESQDFDEIGGFLPQE